MNYFLINQYLKRITKEDILNYASKENINLTPREVNIIYIYLNTKAQSFFEGNHLPILKELKEQLQPKTYQKIEELYNLYKDKL